MNVFSKYLIKSITEKKGRTLLLLASISISAALLVTSMGSIKALLGTLSAQIKGNAGDFNVVLSPDRSLEVPIFELPSLGSYGVKKSFKSISIGGYLTKDNEKMFSLTGTSLSDFKRFDVMKLLNKKEFEPFEGRKLIISEKASKSLKVKPGDELILNILGIEYSYKIAGIAANTGLFFMDKEKQFTFITPEENLFSIYGKEDMYSTVLLSVKSKDLDNWVKDFNEKNIYNKIAASKLYDEKTMEQQLGMIKAPLFFMLAIVLLMTTFIIYSSFKLIITERLSIIGVFLSQGATKISIIKILLRESLAYGVIGGILGDLIGAGLTNLVAYFGNPLKEYGVKATVEYYPPYFIIGFVFAIILSLLSTIIPILSVRKLPVKDIILNTISTSNKISLKSTIIGFIFITAAALLHIFRENIDYAGSVPSIFLAFVGVIAVIPKLVDIVCYPLVRLLRNINGLSMLSFNNVRTSKVLMNNIRLIAVSVVSIVMITSLGNSITEVVDGAYKGMNFDVAISVNSNYAKNISDIVTSYENATEIIESGNISTTLQDDPTKNLRLAFVDPEKHKDFENYTVFEDKEKQLDALKKDDDGIIISKQISLRYDIKVGDTIVLVAGNKSADFKVLSVFNAKLMNSGNYNLISLKGALRNFDIKYPDQYNLSTRIPASQAKKELEKKLKGLGATVITKAEMNKSNEEGNY